MKIKELSISNLRNHLSTNIEFGSSLNIFYGKNGAGKTTILEALSILSLTKSFLPTSDSQLIKNGSNSYAVSLTAVNDISLPYEVSINYESNNKKKINTISDVNLIPKDIIGEIPIVILSPDYKQITFGSPQERRTFIDAILCQSSKTYLDRLINLKKCIKQRNNLLTLAKKDKFFDYSEIEPWTEMLINLSADITLRRYKFVHQFLPFFYTSYRDISQGNELVNIEYEANFIDLDTINMGIEKIKDRLSEVAEKIKHKEYFRGTTLFGPQRDELKIIINGGLAKDYASQGQHKSLLISLKFAEFEFLKENRNETPILLLDDIFSELDNIRSSKVLDLIDEHQAQTFITMTESDRFISGIKKNNENKLFEIIEGTSYKKELTY